MDKKLIKAYLKEMISEEATPGIAMQKKHLKASGKINKDGVKDIEKNVSTSEKSVTKSNNQFEPKVYNYDSDFEKTYHDEMEIMNGQEMIQYDSDPNKEFVDRATEAIEGSSRMGNNPEWANVIPAQQGFTGPDFGKELVKKIKASGKKRSKETPTLNLRGRDIQADLKDTGHKPYAIEEGVIKENIDKKYTHFLLDKQNNDKIVSGWDYKGLDSDDIKHYTKMDIHDMFPDRKSNEFKVISKKFLESKGINPFDMNNWVGAPEKTGLPQPIANENNEKNNKQSQIKETMKRLRFKNEFKGLGNALKLIPENYKVNAKEFEMTDGNESYRIRWEGNLSEGKAIILTASDKKLVNEDITRMKALFGYKSEDTLGLVKGNARIDENKIFGDIWTKSKQLLGESEDIEGTTAPEGNWEDETKKAPEATKHIEGSTSTDKGTQAPKPKEGNWEDAAKKASEATKHIEGSTSTDKGTVAPKPKEGHWEDNVKGQAPEAKKHVHLKETEEAEKVMEDEEIDIMAEEFMSEGDEDGEDTDTSGADNWNKPDADDADADVEPTGAPEMNIPEPSAGPSDDEDMDSPMAVKATLLHSPSNNEYWIKHGTTSVRVPDEYLPIAMDKTKKGAVKASIILKKMEAEETEETPEF